MPSWQRLPADFRLERSDENSAVRSARRHATTDPQGRRSAPSTVSSLNHLIIVNILTPFCLSGDVGERLVRRTVARRVECSRSDFGCPGMSGEIGAEDRGRQGQAFEVGLCLSGDVGEGLVRRTVAGRAECSRSDFVCPGMSGEIGAEDRGGQGQAFEVGLCLSGDVGEGLVRKTVAGRAEYSRSDFLCPGMSGRDWCRGPWRAGPNVRGRTLFVRGCRGGTGAEDRGGQGQAFEVGLCLSGEY